MNDKELMLRAIRLSEESVKNGGGPFGAVIARNGEVVAEASNCVTIDCDPTAHAIRFGSVTDKKGQYVFDPKRA